MGFGELRVTRAALGTPIFLCIVLVLGGLCQLLWTFIKFSHPNYGLMLQGDTYNSHWYLLAFVLLVIAGFRVSLSRIRTWISPIEMTLGAFAAWLILLVTVSVRMPGASFLFFWPLAPMVVATGVSFWFRNVNNSTLIRVLILIVGGAPGILMFAPFIKALYIGLTPNQIGIVMTFLVLFLGLLTPLLDMLAHSCKLQSALLVTGLGFLLMGSLTSGFDTKHPQPNNLFYALDTSGHAFWLSTDKSLDNWTRTFFSNAKEKQRVPELFGSQTSSFWVSSAPLLSLPAPVIDVLGDSISSDIRTITIQVKSLRKAPEFDVYVEGIGVISSKLEDRLLSQNFVPEWNFQGFGFSEKGVRIELTIKAGLPFKIRVIDFSYELPGTGFLPRPPGMIAQPFGMSDTTAVVNVISFK
jgi:hypothetical protein